jgi:putative protease
VTGFLERNPLSDGQNYEESHTAHQSHRFVGMVKKWDNNKKMATIAVRNKFGIGDEVEIFNPQNSSTMKIGQLFTTEGETIEVAHGGGQDIMIPLQDKPDEYSLLRKIIK